MTMRETQCLALDLERVAAELRSREPIFHRPEFGIKQSDFENMIVDDFWEVGASGKVYDRDFVLDTLEKRHTDPAYKGDELTVENCKCRPLSDNVYLFTYDLWQNQRQTRRATVWNRADGTWRAVYHQGTAVE